MEMLRHGRIKAQNHRNDNKIASNWLGFDKEEKKKKKKWVAMEGRPVVL